LKEVKGTNQFEMAFTELRNNQIMSAHNHFVRMAENEPDRFRSALFYLLAAECKSRQGKNTGNEVLNAGTQYLKLAEDVNFKNRKNAYMCAAKCFLKIGKYNEANDAYEKYQKLKTKSKVKTRPIIIIEDSEAIIMKIESYLKKLDYTELHSFTNGNDALKASEKLLNQPQTPIILLDVGLPDISGDEIATKLLQTKIDLPIILITADEKSSEKVHKTISSGVSSYIQKPFGLDDLAKAIEKIETEDIVLKK